MGKQEKVEVTISAAARKTLLLDVYKRHRIEACGLLLGSIDDVGNWHAEEVYPLRNIFDSPVYFEFAPEELLAVELEHAGEIVGVYHSHPTGFSVASATDRENMQRVNVEEQIPWVWLIVRGPFDMLWQEQRVPSAVIAYHHYEQWGLQEIPVQFVQRQA